MAIAVTKSLNSPVYSAARAFALADGAVNLDTGLVVFDGTAHEVLNNEELRSEYLAI